MQQYWRRFRHWVWDLILYWCYSLGVWRWLRRRSRVQHTILAQALCTYLQEAGWDAQLATWINTPELIQVLHGGVHLINIAISGGDPLLRVLVRTPGDPAMPGITDVDLRDPASLDQLQELLHAARHHHCPLD